MGTRGLRGSGVVVTGAAGGIGSAVARRFAQAGARVCAVDVDAAGLDVLRSDLGSVEGHHLFTTLDIRDLSAHAAVFDEVRSAFGRFDHLAHLAAVFHRVTDIDLVTEEDWDEQMDVNLKASFFLMRQAARSLKQNGVAGSITAFSSIGSRTGGDGGSVAYCASKAGVDAVVRAMARTYAGSGVRVNAVLPGSVDTRMMRIGLSGDEVDSIASGIPLRRLATPDEIADVVMFVTSDEARYITGATINVSGGSLMY